MHSRAQENLLAKVVTEKEEPMAACWQKSQLGLMVMDCQGVNEVSNG